MNILHEIEKELSELDTEDAQVFMQDLGIKEPALNKLIRTSYDLLGLIAFFTVGEDECRSWTIRKGTNAQKAAGVIHSDLEKGFIRAETVHYDDLIEQGSLTACKDKGLLRLEGKEYRPTVSLSGGEKQALAIASVLALRPSILVLDEVTSMLDPIGTEMSSLVPVAVSTSESFESSVELLSFGEIL